MKSLAPRRPRAVVVLLMLLLTLVFALEGVQPIHTHENGRLGLYNAECPLSQLAAVHTDGWAPQSLATASPAQVTLPAAATSHVWAPSPAASFTDSRAPPLA